MIRRIAVCLGALIALSPPVAAQQDSPDWTRCINKGDTFPSDAAIAGCTAVLQSKSETTNGRAVAYNYRGAAYIANYVRQYEPGGKDAIAGAYDRGIDDFSEAIRLNPGYADAYSNRGRAYLILENYHLAISDFSEAIRLNPSDAKAYDDRGLAYLKGGSGELTWSSNSAREAFDRAIADYSEAIKLDPSKVHRYYGRGTAYSRKGDYDHGIADYSEVIRLNPSDSDGYKIRAGVYLAKGDYDRAIADYSEAIRLNPSDAEGYSSRAGVYLVKGDYDRAIADYGEAIRLDPSDDEGYSSRAGAYLVKGDYDRAIADYSEAIRLQPGFPQAAYTDRGIAYLYTGKLAQAQADFKQAGDVNPRDAYAALWLDLAERRSGLPSRLKDAVPRLDMSYWPAPVVSLYLGELTPAQAIAAAGHDQVCEANFFAGTLLAVKGQKDDAVRLLRSAFAGCPRGPIIMRTAARAELKLLGVEP
jgi:tetratricopeptide (TPR) repeat protein